MSCGKLPVVPSGRRWQIVSRIVNVNVDIVSDLSILGLVGVKGRGLCFGSRSSARLSPEDQGEIDEGVQKCVMEWSIRGDIR